MLRAPPRPATASAPLPSMTRRRPAAAFSRASPQVAGCNCPSFPRTRGVVRRSGEDRYSKPKRPLSHSQPWLVGPLSTPRKRTTWLAVAWTAMRQPDRAVRAGALHRLQVPGPGPEPVGGGGEGPHRADLHGVAREVGGEGLAGEGEHLGVVAPGDELDQGVAGHLVGEPGAAGAQDAALPVEQHQVADRDGLGVVALLLDVAALPGAVGEGLVLQGALPALVAHRAVEGVVGQQELEHPFLGLLDDVGGGVHHHALGHPGGAGGGQGPAAGPFDLHQAHAAHAHRLQAGVRAEAGDVGAGPLRDRDEVLPGVGLHRAPVDGEGDPLSHGRLR